jgi:hypothetical protein
LSAVLLVSPVAAQQDTVGNLFEKVTELFGTKGLKPTGFESRGMLAAGASQTLSVPFKGGASLAIIGVCDENCKDLNLYVADSKGNEVASDVEDDDAPLALVKERGTYTVRVEMKACGSSNCKFGIKTFVN